MKLSILLGVFTGLVSLVSHPACLADDPPPKPLNVLFIAVDDLRTELGCYGLAYAKSPHLDRLASEGVLFENHFVQVPTCGASRYALLTGRSPARSRALSNGALYQGPSRLSLERLEGAQTLPELFRRGGYHTVCIGKISHTPDGKVFDYSGGGDGRAELPHAWNQLATPYGPWKRGWGAFFAYEGGRHREDGEGHRDLMEFSAENDDDLPDGLLARRAMEELRQLRDRGQPFFLGLGFFKPHLPFVATRADWEAMAKVEVPLPPHPDRVAGPYSHRSGEFFGYEATFAAAYPIATEDQIKARRAYLACVRFVDRQVGRVLRTLDDLGLRDSTVVVVWGDHGWHLGDSAMWGKHSPFERALRSTLIIRAPGCVAGLKSGALVESLDVYPTLVDLCQPTFRRTQHPLDGHSLGPLLRGEKKKIRDAAISYWRSIVSVRTSGHRLIATLGKGAASKVELYDVGEGPDPVRNIAADEPQLRAHLLGLIPKILR